MNIPEKVVKRLTLYHCICTDYAEKNIEFIASPQIANLLNIDESLVRKDLKYLNNTGKCRVGYDVSELEKAVEETLGFAVAKKAFIIGAGNLGTALTKYDDFSKYGINIIALFDNNPLKIDTTINHIRVFHLRDLPSLAKKQKVDFAILTVPRQFAQEVADVLVEAEIKNIWNFTPCVLKVPSTVKVRNENLMASCLRFTVCT